VSELDMCEAAVKCCSAFAIPHAKVGGARQCAIVCEGVFDW
jgi:hypothetical protein